MGKAQGSKKNAKKNPNSKRTKRLGSGLTATFLTHKLAYSWFSALLAIVVVAAIVIAAVFYRMNYVYTAPHPSTAAMANSNPAESPVDDGSLPDVSAALAQPQTNSALGTLAGQVSDAATGKTLWDKDSSTPMVPASSTKLLTSTAALLSLGADDTVSTTVRKGTQPGQIVLVGGGDVTLAPNENSAFYTDAPTIADLAAQVKKAMAGESITSVVVDNSLASVGPTFNPTWDRADIAGGNVTNVDSVMINGGRLDYSNEDSARTDSPAKVAGKELASQLGVDQNSVTVSSSPVGKGNEQIGEVKSAPLDIRMHDMLVHSDNMEAEALGREIAAKAGKPRTFEGATQATLNVLKDNGFSVDKVTLKDNSGMSTDNRINPAALDSVLLAAAGSGDHSHQLRVLLDELPIAAGNGTLVDRYTSGSSSAGAGWVRAKTGTLSGVNALAGTVITDQGRVLTFAFMSNGSETDPARAALDDLAAALRGAKS